VIEADMAKPYYSASPSRAGKVAPRLGLVRGAMRKLARKPKKKDKR